MNAVTVANWGMNLVVAVTFLTLVAVLGHAGAGARGQFAIVRLDRRRRLDPHWSAGAGKQGEESPTDGSARALWKASTATGEATNPRILTIHGGWPSIMPALFEAGDARRRTLEDGMERIGSSQADVRVGGSNPADDLARPVAATHRTVAVGVRKDGIEELLGGDPLSAAGHRVVRGGPCCGPKCSKPPRTAAGNRSDPGPTPSAGSRVGVRERPGSGVPGGVRRASGRPAAATKAPGSRPPAHAVGGAARRRLRAR
jgi:hypothetical protein